jgi:hypothetical protein
MSEMKFVVPTKGQIVRFPKTYIKLPENGSNVPWSGSEGNYWRRRFAEGSIQVVDMSYASPEIAIEQPKKEGRK